MIPSLLGAVVIVGTRIGHITVDCTPEQTHRFPSRITENPVEDGSVYTDHVVLLPAVVEIIGRISNASIFPTLSQYTYHDAFQELVRLQSERTPFVVVTGLNVYQNMLIEDITIPRNANDGQSMRFTAVLREVQIVGRDVLTNRELVSEDVRPTALSYVNNGLVQTFPLAPPATLVAEPLT